MRRSLLLGLAWLVLVAAAVAVPGNKADLTPAFCQRDPDADFDNGGNNFCVPAAMVDGLIYLGRIDGIPALVNTDDHTLQIGLMKELAQAMGTDAERGGTTLDKGLTGLQDFVQAKACHFDRLDIVTWCRLNADNRTHVVGRQPKLDWLRAAAENPFCAGALVVGWYHRDERGYVRKGGHCVALVGAGDDLSEFQIHNPGLPAEQQAERILVKLTPMSADDLLVVGRGTRSLDGYYRVDGPALPYGRRTDVAILEAAIIFSLKQ